MRCIDAHTRPTTGFIRLVIKMQYLLALKKKKKKQFSKYSVTTIKLSLSKPCITSANSEINGVISLTKEGVSETSTIRGLKILAQHLSTAFFIHSIADLVALIDLNSQQKQNEE